LAAPQNAAQVSNAQQAPQVAQQVAQAAFAAQAQKREETVAEGASVEGSVINANADGGDGRSYTPRQRRKRGEEPEEDTGGALFASDDHFIDFSA
jgi:hypothetical protein